MKKTIRILAIVVVLSVIWLVARGQGGCAVEPVPVEVEVDGTVTNDHYAGAEIYGSGFLGKIPADPGGSRKKTVKIIVYAFPGQIVTQKGELTIICEPPAGPPRPHRKHTHVIYEVSTDKWDQHPAYKCELEDNPQ